MGTRPVSEDGGGASTKADPPSSSSSTSNPAGPSSGSAVHLQRLSSNQSASKPAHRRPESESHLHSSASASSGRVSSARVGGRRRAETDNQMRSSLPPMLSSDVVLDRRLLQKYEQVNQEIERVVRASQMDQHFTGMGDVTSANHIKNELRQAKKSSAQMIHAQKEL
ncbi:Hypothetical protein PHPALM_12342, partial [Phytophthora palmivora]